jgi:hypothetical protein
METEKESHFQETFMAQFENDLGVQTLQNFGAVFAPTMSAGAVKVRIDVSLVFGSLVAHLNSLICRQLHPFQIETGCHDFSVGNDL